MQFDKSVLDRFSLDLRSQRHIYMHKLFLAIPQPIRMSLKEA